MRDAPDGDSAFDRGGPTPEPAPASPGTREPERASRHRQPPLPPRALYALLMLAKAHASPQSGALVGSGAKTSPLGPPLGQANLQRGTTGANAAATAPSGSHDAHAQGGPNASTIVPPRSEAAEPLFTFSPRFRGATVLGAILMATLTGALEINDAVLSFLTRLGADHPWLEDALTSALKGILQASFEQLAKRLLLWVDPSGTMFEAWRLHQIVGGRPND